jgi:hypothetical protein
MAGNFCWNLVIGAFCGCSFAALVLFLLHFARTSAAELTLTITAVCVATTPLSLCDTHRIASLFFSYNCCRLSFRLVTFYVSEEGLCRASGVVATMATSYILHNRHAFPMLPPSRAIISAASNAFAAVSAAVVAAAAGSSLAFFWSFSKMSPSPVRPADWGNIIALALVLLLFRAIFLLIHCASVTRLSGAAAPPPSPLDILIATLSSSSSPLTIAFGLVICNITTRYSIHLRLPSLASTRLIPHHPPTPLPAATHPTLFSQSCGCSRPLLLHSRPRHNFHHRFHNARCTLHHRSRALDSAVSSPLAAFAAVCRYHFYGRRAVARRSAAVSASRARTLVYHRIAVLLSPVAAAQG